MSKSKIIIDKASNGYIITSEIGTQVIEGVEKSLDDFILKSTVEVVHQKLKEFNNVKVEIEVSDNLKMTDTKITDTGMCNKCGGRTALVVGCFSYEPDAEPYESGVEEESMIHEGEVNMVACKCDICGNMQGFSYK